MRWPLLWGVGVFEVETMSHISQPLWHTVNLLTFFFLSFSTLTYYCLFGTLIIYCHYLTLFLIFFYKFLHIISPPMPCCFHHKAFSPQMDKRWQFGAWWLRVLPKQNYVLGLNGAHSCTLMHTLSPIRKNMTHLLRCHFLTSLKYEFTLGVNYSQYMKWNQSGLIIII
jgi:hypothetical protein